MGAVGGERSTRVEWPHWVCVLGNAVVVKPSEVSEHTSQLIADILPQYLDQVSVALCLMLGLS